MRVEDIIEELINIPNFFLLKRDKNLNYVDFSSNINGPLEVFSLNPKTENYKLISKGHFESSFIRLPQRNSIIFAKDKDGDEKYALYMMDLETDEITQLTTPPHYQEFPLTLSPDGCYLAFTSQRERSTNIYKLDLSSNDIIQLTNHKRPFNSYVFWSSNGWLYYSANETDNRLNYDIWVVKEDGSENELFYRFSDTSSERILDMSKDYKYLLISTDGKKTIQSGVLELETKEVKWYGTEEFDERPMEISDDNSKVMVRRSLGVKRTLVLYDRETKEEETISVDGVFSAAQFWNNDESIVYTFSAPKIPNSIWRYDFRDKTHEILVKPKIPLTDEQLCDSQYIEYRSFDGLKIPANLIKPKLESNKKYPAIVFLIGGPGGNASLIFDSIGQIFAQSGFVWLIPNIRGSSGFGTEYYKMNIMDLGGGDAKDVVYAKKYLESLDYVDPRRIAAFGGSYGGYMTYLLLTKYSDANWKAGSAWVGITHWKTNAEQAPGGYKELIEGLLGKYEENKELWEDRSPLTHVDKIKAPIQMIQTVNDPRCPIGESRQFRDRLLELGKKEGEDFEYIELGEKGHGIKGKDDLANTIKLVLDFFKRRLKE